MNSFTGQFIILCWAIFLIYFFIAAFSVKRTAEGRGFRSWGWRFPILAAVLIVIFIKKSRMFSKSAAEAILWQRTFAVGITSDLLALIGLIVALWARSTLGGNWSSDVVLKENHELIERGPYAYVRHPIYSGVLLMALGSAVISGRAGAFIVLAILFLGLWFKALQEERLLTKHFPEVYPKYKQRVKAFIPFLF
jgi:protein-S-isoprenylcysteine O-methyltransferase Ste14